MWVSLRSAWRSVAARTNVIIVSAVGAILSLAVDYVPRPSISGASSLAYEVLRLCLIFYLVLYVVWWCAVVVCLLCGRFRRAIRYAAAVAIFYVGLSVPTALDGGEGLIPRDEHATVAELYQNRWPVIFESTVEQSSSARIVALYDAGHPPHRCETWIVLDPSHTSGAERDIGLWHRPRAPLFAQHDPPLDETAIDLRRIDEGAYSVVMCASDPRPWWLRLWQSRSQ